MISVSAASGRTVAVAIAYAFGSAVVLLGLTLGGRALFDRVRQAGRGPLLQRTLGVIMILTALAIVTNLDVRFDQQVAERIPDVNLTASLEKSHAVESRLPELSGHEAKFKPSISSPSAPHGASDASLLAIAHKLPNVGTAPDFTDTEDWFNTGRVTPQPLTLTSLRGRVVLVDFWTYTCINCIRTLPYLKAWDATYRGQGLTIVGVETPEFAFERDASNVSDAIDQFGIRYPVVQDNEMGTWNAYGNQYWPADYLIDAKGQVRYATFGEGDYDKTETAIRALLAEAGHDVAGHSHPTGVIVPSLASHAGDLSGNGSRAGLGHRPRRGRARLQRRPSGPTGSQQLRLQRHLEHRRPARHRGLERRDRRGVPGQERVPRAELGREHPAPGAGAARRPADPGRGRRSRRARRRRHGQGRAPLHARLAAPQRTSPPEPALRARGHRVRVHVRLKDSALGGIRATGRMIHR